MIQIGDIKELNGEIYLIGREDTNKKVILKRKRSSYPFKSFFYIKKDSKAVLEHLISNTSITGEMEIELEIKETDKKSLFDDELLKVFYRTKSLGGWGALNRFFIDNKSILFESDIYDNILFCLDEFPQLKNEFDLNFNWRKTYIDIETKSTGPISDPNSPTDEILCVTVYDSYEEKYRFFYTKRNVSENEQKMIEENKGIDFYGYETEQEMLKLTLEYIGSLESDVIMGWNVHFDVSYMLNRYKEISEDTIPLVKLSKINLINYDVKRKEYSVFGTIIFDLLKGYMRVHRLGMSGYSLDNVSSEELGENKIEVDVKTLFQLPIEKLFEYNKKDVELCIRLDNKLHIFNFHDSLRKFIGCPFDSVEYASSMIDFLLLKKARERNIVLPTRPNDSDRKVFKGAFVDAIPGKYKNVINFDVKGMYPNIIKTFNLSIESVNKEGEIKLEKINISKKKRGIMTQIIDDLLYLRTEYDIEKDKYPYGHPEHDKFDMLIESVKCIIDAVYGVNAYPRFRLFKAEISEAITFLGRKIIEHTREKLDSMGYKVVLTDTDSCDFIVPGDKNMTQLEKEGYEVLEVINRDYIEWISTEFNISKEECYIKNAFKKIYSRMIVGAKKRYVCRVIWSKGLPSSGVEIVGFHQKRSDCSRFGRDLQYQLIDMLLNDQKEPDKDEIYNFLFSKTKEMKKLTPMELAIPTKIEKNLDEYGTDLPKVRGAKYSSKILDVNFYRGDKPLLLFTVGDSDVILFFKNYEAEKLLNMVRINWPKMMERNIFLVSEMLLENSGMGDILNTLKLESVGQKTLSSFLGGENVSN